MAPHLYSYHLFGRALKKPAIPLILSEYCKLYFSIHSLNFGLFEETIHTLDICAGSIKSKGETVTEDKQ